MRRYPRPSPPLVLSRPRPVPAWAALTYSPNLVRAALSDRAATAQMADDFRVMIAQKGCVERDDLELLGWRPAQIDGLGPAARLRAQRDAERSPEPVRRQRPTRPPHPEEPAQRPSRRTASAGAAAEGCLP
jgi:hypothetical protein